MKRFCALLIVLCVALFASSCMAAEIDLAKAIETGEATKTVITPLVDGKELKVNWYVAPYVAKPNRPSDQLINIYVPENATEASPILFVVNNGGWFMDDYAATVTDRDGIAIKDGANYQTEPDAGDDLTKGREQFSAMALKRGFVIVSYGARARNDGATDGKFLGHSPATATDTKAAIRYLRAAATARTSLNISTRSARPGFLRTATGLSQATPRSATTFSRRCHIAQSRTWDTLTRLTSSRTTQ